MSFYVRPQIYWPRIRQSIFFAIVEYLKRLGIKRISLGLAVENNIAKKVYMNHGFKFTGVIVNEEHIYTVEL
ncbi:GNAT family N-acetyltransferase [Providencia stuartii]|uniref:GNAT family N-acetyltransferase n=1 Tax=Providencia TaxID=586 RepID=UPI0019807320|nr:GNAT family N-acetyltransferase [Providencia stuartii]MBN4879348.1 GNAT family N-acetyltransferase [Providencia stuartii]